MEKLKNLVVLILNCSHGLLRVLGGVRWCFNKSGRSSIIDGGFGTFVIISRCVSMLNKTCIYIVIGTATVDTNMG